MHRTARGWRPAVCAVVLPLIFFAICVWQSSGLTLQLPPLQATINDFARMAPAVSLEDLRQRLAQFKKQTGSSVVVVTLAELGDEEIAEFGRNVLRTLPLPEEERRKTVVLIIARKERKVHIESGAALQDLFPQPAADEKLQAHVSLYFDGFRPDLGIYSGVNYVFRAITGDLRVDSTSDEERLEERSTTGEGAGAVFALWLAPYLALVVGMLWGVYSTKYRVQGITRVFIGCVLGSGVAKVVAMLISSLGSYGYGLWYFIVACSVLLAGFGSLTEFWMRGDWCAIPRIKDKVKRKPEDHMGI